MMKLLIGKEYTNTVLKIFKEEKNIKCAVAFWGKKALELLIDKDNINIICNLESGAVNPDFVESMRDKNWLKKMKLKKVNIRTMNKLHAKVIITSNDAIVGSANISSNGLSYEDNDAIKGWTEAGILIKDKAIIKEINDWFDKELWKKSRLINEKLLKEAKLTWNKRQIMKSQLQKKSSKDCHSLLNKLRDDPMFFSSRRIFFAIAEEARSKAANNKFKEKCNDSNKFAFEDWDRLPENSYIIGFYKPLNQKIEYLGLFYSPPNKTLLKIKKNNNLILLDIVQNIYGYKLKGKKEYKQIESKIEELIKNKNQYNGTIPLLKARNILLNK